MRKTHGLTIFLFLFLLLSLPPALPAQSKFNPFTGKIDFIGPTGPTGATGPVSSVGLVGTANQITVTGASPITSSGSWTLSFPTNLTLPGTTTGTFLGNVTGTSSLATAIAGGSSGQIPYQTGAGVTAFNAGLAFNTSTGIGLVQGVTSGQSGTATGFYKINGLTSGTVMLSAADAAGTWTMKLPDSGGTVDYVLRTDGTGITSWVAQSGGSGTPAGATSTIQYNNAGSFGGQAMIFGGGSVLSSIQKGDELANVTLTVGGNLTLPAQTTPYTVALATGVSCRTWFSGAVISVVTTFTAGTGVITAKLQHGSADLTGAIDLTQSAGAFLPEVPGMGCDSASTGTVSVVFTGNGSDNLSGFSAGAVKVKIIGKLSE